MKLVGVLLALGGWLLAIAGLFISSTVGVRGVFAVAGIAVSLFGILGVLNGVFLEHAIWKR